MPSAAGANNAQSKFNVLAISVSPMRAVREHGTNLSTTDTPSPAMAITTNCPLLWADGLDDPAPVHRQVLFRTVLAPDIRHRRVVVGAWPGWQRGIGLFVVISKRVLVARIMYLLGRVVFGVLGR
jgi:hypothetical protein